MKIVNLYSLPMAKPQRENWIAELAGQKIDDRIFFWQHTAHILQGVFGSKMKQAGVLRGQIYRMQVVV